MDSAQDFAPFLGSGRSPFVESPAVAELLAAFDTEQPPRLSLQDAATLYFEANLFTLGQLAQAARWRKHPEPVVTYVVDRNINYSNVCVCACRFCAYFRPPGDPECFVLTRAELAAKIEETLALGGGQILLQGGHHPDLGLDWYEELLRFIKQYPIHVHAFSPPEIVFLSQREKLPVPEVVARLKAAGLDSIPGGGAEILVDEVRAKVSPNKCSASAWLGVMEEAHKLGLRTTATMMFGHEETPLQRLEHLFAVRALQDRTGGFTAFIPWTFQPENTNIRVTPQTSPSYLRLLAVARLVLDNVDNIQASWVTMGPKIGQLSLSFGANDFGSTMIEENVVAAAGVRYRLLEPALRALVAEAGFTPKRRTMDYRLLE
jgi:cyclic dehypoxanthinyl futalosine synthase